MTIWLDVTTTFGWNRPALGIVRVEAEIARQFLASADSHIRFCRFEVGSGRHVVVGRDEVGHVLARLDAGGCAAPVGSVPTPTPVPSAEPTPGQATEGREQRLKRRILGLVSRLPPRYRERAHRFARSRGEALAALVRAYREARLAAAVMWRGMAPAVESAQPVHQPPAGPPAVDPPFAAGDVYVSLGLDWDQKDLVNLYGWKRQLGFKALLFCYDVIPIRRPHLCVAEVAEKFPRYFVDAAWCADQIVCISECSRRDLREYLESVGAPVPVLDVVRLGCDIVAASDSAPSPLVAEVLAEPFILYVSTVERRKNHETLYRAYVRLVDEGRRDLPRLVFVGMPGWGVSELMADLRLDPRIQPYIRILNHVSDGDLRRLYEDARFTVYPSLYEGWGLPVAESLAYGKCCLASSAASIPEVGGDLIEYLDPWDVPAWAEKLAWYFDHPEDVAKREAAIRADYRPATWQETGNALLAKAMALECVNEKGENDDSGL